MHYMIWSDSFLLLIGLLPGVYPLLLKFLVHFLPPLHNLCKIIYSQHTLTFSVFVIITVAKTFYSFFFQLLWCQPCRLWKSRSSNTSIFIDVSGRIHCHHNFIHYKVAKELNCFLYPAPEFKVMVANGGTINFSGKFHNIKLTM